MALQTYAFTKAKNELSTLMNDAVDHLPQAITRHSREAAVLMSLGDLRIALSDKRFDVQVAHEQGEVIAALEDFGLIGAGPDLDTAMDRLLDELNLFCDRYMEDFAFYVKTEKARLFGWVLRFLATPDEDRRELLFEVPRRVAAPA